MWYHLRDRRLGGHKFRRQHRIGPFIVDFVCSVLETIVSMLQSNSPHPDPLPEGEGVEPSA
jgi:very-short-patch-repair endonuclease